MWRCKRKKDRKAGEVNVGLKEEDERNMEEEKHEGEKSGREMKGWMDGRGRKKEDRNMKDLMDREERR